MSTCLITGCELVAQGKWCHGDLHAVGGAYVFNAYHVQGAEAYWQYDNLPGDERMILRIDGDYFERRGVIVMAQTAGVLNDRAAKYVSTPVSWVDSVLGS